MLCRMDRSGGTTHVRMNVLGQSNFLRVHLALVRVELQLDINTDLVNAGGGHGVVLGCLEFPVEAFGQHLDHVTAHPTAELLL